MIADGLTSELNAVTPAYVVGTHMLHHLAHAGTGVHVYVLDTGILSDHVQFRQMDAAGQPAEGVHFPGTSRVSPKGYSGFNDNSWEDCNGHGTHVAAIIGGEGWWPTHT